MTSIMMAHQSVLHHESVLATLLLYGRGIADSLKESGLDDVMAERLEAALEICHEAQEMAPPYKAKLEELQHALEGVVGRIGS
jgi:hypothetical protein